MRTAGHPGAIAIDFFQELPIAPHLRPEANVTAGNLFPGLRMPPRLVFRRKGLPSVIARREDAVLQSCNRPTQHIHDSVHRAWYHVRGPNHGEDNSAVKRRLLRHDGAPSKAKHRVLTVHPAVVSVDPSADGVCWIAADESRPNLHEVALQTAETWQAAFSMVRHIAAPLPSLPAQS